MSSRYRGNRNISALLKRHLVAENEFAYPISLSCHLWSDQCKYQLSKHRVLNEKEVNVPSKNLNNTVIQ